MYIWTDNKSFCFLCHKLNILALASTSFSLDGVMPFTSLSGARSEEYGAVLIIVHDPVLEVRCPISCTIEALLGSLSSSVICS